MKSDAVPPKCGPKTPSSSMLHGSNLCFFFSLWTGRYVVLSADTGRNLKGIFSNNVLKEYIFMKYFRKNVTPRSLRNRHMYLDTGLGIWIVQRRPQATILYIVAARISRNKQKKIAHNH